MATVCLLLAAPAAAQTTDSLKTATDTLRDSPELFLSDLEKFVAARERQVQLAPAKMEQQQQELWEALQKRRKNLIDAMTPKQRTDLRQLEERYKALTKSTTTG